MGAARQVKAEVYLFIRMDVQLVAVPVVRRLAR